VGPDEGRFPRMVNWLVHHVDSLPPPERQLWMRWLNAYVFLVCLALSLAILAPTSLYLLDNAERLLRHPAARPVIFGTTVSIGLLLYWLRARFRIAYAALEIGFALVTMYQATEAIEREQTVSLAACAAAAYLLVRGLDNMRQGIEATRTAEALLRKLAGSNVRA
jgi:hypothetical protein